VASHLNAATNAAVLSGQRRWAPLLVDERARRAKAAAEQILKESRCWRFSAEGASKRGALWGGVPAMALLAGYLIADGAAADACCNEMIDEAAALAEGTGRLDLFYGVAGFGWVASHLGRRLAGLHDYDLRDVDALVEKYLQRLAMEHPSARPPHALLEGAIGTGLYALERVPRESATRALGHVLDYLETSARESRLGVWWEHAPSGANPSTIVLGPAHGTSGALVFLARVYAKGMFRARVGTLLDKATEWLLAQRLPPAAGSVFPHPLVGSAACEESSLSWCHGDPGIAGALYSAGTLVGRDDWKAIAVRAACKAAGRFGEHVRDAGLCHGSAGLAHIFNRLYQATGEERLREAALRWFDITLYRRVEGRGVAGFRVWHGDETSGKWASSIALLSGALGIGLALLAATADVAPDWDQLLVISGGD